MIIMYELTAGYRGKTSGTYHHEVYRMSYFNLESVKVRKATVDELYEMLCDSGD